MQKRIFLVALPLTGIAVWLAAGFYSNAGPPLTDHASGAVETTAPDADIERQIAELLIASYEAGQAVEEDPHLWELIRQLKPDQAVTLGE